MERGLMLCVMVLIIEIFYEILPKSLFFIFYGMAIWLVAGSQRYSGQKVRNIWLQ
jgi:hypothetical protein